MTAGTEMTEDIWNYSALMAVYCKEKPDYLRSSIESMLNQTVMMDEFVVVRDGPLTRELDAVLMEYDALYPGLFIFVSLENNAGLGPALAAGIRTCRNELIARMDSDDISDERRCEVLLAEFKRDQRLDVVGCFENEFFEDAQVPAAVHKVPEFHDEICRFLKRRCPILHPTVIYRKSAVLSCGNYKDYTLFEDYDLFARMIRNEARCYNVQAAYYNLRISDSFFRRRGGLRYLHTQLVFKFVQLKSGNISLVDFMISAGTQAIVCVLPNKLRRFIYLKLLRR